MSHTKFKLPEFRSSCRSSDCNTATRPLNISQHHNPTVADGHTTTTRRGSRARYKAAHAHMHDHDRRCSPAVPAWCVHALVVQNSSGGVPLCVHEKIVPTSAIPPMTAKAATTLQQHPSTCCALRPPRQPQPHQLPARACCMQPTSKPTTSHAQTTFLAQETINSCSHMQWPWQQRVKQAMHVSRPILVMLNKQGNRNKAGSHR